MLDIHPGAIYDDGSIVLGLDLSYDALARARRQGRLRYSRQGRRVLYLGQWIRDWLESDACSQMRAEGERNAL